MEIRLPLAHVPLSLPEPHDLSIDSSNVAAVSVVFASMQLEDMNAFAVVDRLAELFGQGLLPLQGRPAAILSGYLAQRQDRLRDTERRAIYRRVLGVGGDDDGTANREFNACWIAYVSAVDAAAHPPDAPDAMMQARERVHLTRQALAANVSLHGAGIGAVAAKLRQQIAGMVELLSAPEVQSASGARDMWQVIDRVGRELGGASTAIARLRARLQSGLVILRSVAATNQPTEQELAAACAIWLQAT